MIMKTTPINAKPLLVNPLGNPIAGLAVRYFKYADQQEKNHTLWFFLALMIHGVFFLASPAILIWMYQAPLAVLFITIVNFFINLIANMGGAGIRTTITLFYAGLLVNVGMILFYVL